MGLDSVEMIVSIEDRFGVHFADRDLEEVRTVGDVYLLLSRTLAAVPSDKCKTQGIFYRLRRSLPVRYHSTFTPFEDLQFYLSGPQAKLTYRELARDTGLLLPSLRTPKWYKRSVALLMILSLLSLATISPLLHLPQQFMLTAGCILAILIYPLTAKYFRYCIPQMSVRQFVEETTVMNIRWPIKKAYRETDVLPELRRIIAESIGVTVEEVTMDARFSEDLGVE